MPLDNDRFVRGVVEEPIGLDSNILALIIPGTHSYDRNGSDQSVNQSGGGIYRHLALALRNQGFTVARSDAPVSAPAATNPCTQREEQESIDTSLISQSDAMMVMTTHFRHSDKNFKKIILIGHSQGGMLAAQFIAENPNLIDGLFTYGMTLRPMLDATAFQFKNIRLNALRNIVEKSSSRCVSNTVVASDSYRGELTALTSPIERWFSPTGQWCDANLDVFAKKLDDDILNLLIPTADNCKKPGTKNSDNRVNNSCDEILLFSSTQSIPSLLKNYQGTIGLAMGSNDSLLEGKVEQKYFDMFSKESTGKRVLRFIDGAGHVFGEHPFMGPENDSYLANFANFLAHECAISKTRG